MGAGKWREKHVEKVHRWSRSSSVSHLLVEVEQSCLVSHLTSDADADADVIMQHSPPTSLARLATGMRKNKSKSHKSQISSGNPIPPPSLVWAGILVSRIKCWWRLNNPVLSLIWPLMLLPVCLILKTSPLHFCWGWMWIWQKGFLLEVKWLWFFLIWRTWLECQEDSWRWIL